MTVAAPPAVHSSAEAGPRYYRHSGKIDFSGTLVSLVASCVFGVVAAGVYAAVVRYLPSEKLCCLACLAFGLVMGAIPASLMRTFKVRNIPVTLGVVLISTAVAYYAAWVVWETLLMRHGTAQTALRLARHPDAVYRIAGIINANGAWSLGETHDPVTGKSLDAVWLGEALILFGTALAVARAMMRSNLFCEQCRRWSPPAKTVRVTAPLDPQQLRQQLEAGDYRFVSDLKPPTGNEFLTFTRQGCPGCGELNTLSVTSRRVVKDKRGRVRKSRVRTIVDKLLVTPADYEKLAPPTVAPPEPQPIATA